MKKEAIAKAWDWEKVEDTSYWEEVAIDIPYLAYRWKRLGKRRFLDFGCGLGRHSRYFLEQGFEVKAFDLSPEAVKATKALLPGIEVIQADMHHLPYENGSFDCLLASHVVSHTDSKGFKTLIKELLRVLSPSGEFFLDVCAKTLPFPRNGASLIDERTIVLEEDGPEKGIPHIHLSEEDIPLFFEGAELLNVRKIATYKEEGFESENPRSHFYILGRKKA